jgi:hypothetical protein
MNCGGSLALLLSIVLVSAPAYSVPITYTLVVQCAQGSALCPDPTGSLGTFKFGGANGRVNLTLTFQGDTNNVVAYSVPGAHGYENLVNTSPATIQIYSATTGKLLASATFKAGAAIFVSVDQGNQGVGFGSFGVPPGDPKFPGQPVYPYANYDSQVHTDTYDLKSTWTSGLGFAVTCIGFPTQPCGSPIALPTSAGNLYLNGQFSNGTNLYCCATFKAQTH